MPIVAIVPDGPIFNPHQVVDNIVQKLMDENPAQVVAANLEDDITWFCDGLAQRFEYLKLCGDYRQRVRNKVINGYLSGRWLSSCASRA